MSATQTTEKEMNELRKYQKDREEWAAYLKEKEEEKAEEEAKNKWVWGRP